jgi:hypothetical protein
MARFNYANTVQKTVNQAGFAAYQLTKKELLVSQALNSFFKSDKDFYGDVKTQMLNTVRDLLETDPVFVAKVAVFAREVFNLRTVSHVLMAEIANAVKGEEYVKRVVERAAIRPDDMTEILAYYLTTYGKPIPNSLKKGLQLAFRKFDAYQLAKYNRDNAIKLRDILRLTHPIALNDDQATMWGQLKNDTLPIPYTWETELSAKGNKKEVWEELIASKKVGYMAILRNLRNIVEAGVSDAHIKMVYDYLTNERAVIGSKQLPFRFKAAYDELKKMTITRGNPMVISRFMDAVEIALRISAVKNMTFFPGKTLFAVDVSGSMKSNYVNDKKTISAADIACLLAAIGNFITDEAITVSFDTRLYNVNLSKVGSIIENANGMKVCGGGTDITLPLQYLLQTKLNVDRIILISDNELNTTGYWHSDNIVVCQDLFNKYKAQVNPKTWMHSVDLVGYGTSQFSGDHVDRINGWSEKVFDYMKMVEQGMGGLVKQIEQIVL